MKKTVKQVAGIDVAKDELVVCIGRVFDDLTLELFAHKNFVNHAKGIEQMFIWVNKQTESSVPVLFAMEATGVYHEALAYFLDDHQQAVSIILPNKISNYFRTLDIKTVTDKTSSQAITRFALERNLDIWKRPRKIIKQLRQLTREREQIIAERTVLKNQIHAEESEAFPNKKSLQRFTVRLNLLIKQEKEIKAEITAMINTDNQLKATVDLLCSIPGIGLITAVIILAETNEFELIRNRRQLASYAGFDVKEKLSGTSVKGKPKISKRGNKNLRKAMYLPALTAIRHNERCKALFIRIVEKSGIKMKAVIAVERKLLELTYTIFKTKKPFNKAYFEEQCKLICQVEN